MVPVSMAATDIIGHFVPMGNNMWEVYLLYRKMTDFHYDTSCSKIMDTLLE